MEGQQGGFPKGCWIALGVAGGVGCLLIVLVAVGIAVFGFFVKTTVDEAMDSQIRKDMRAIISATDLYFVNEGASPESVKDLVEGEYLEEEPLDPFGNLYIIEFRDDGSVRIISFGSDGVEGGTGWNRDFYSDDPNFMAPSDGASGDPSDLPDDEGN